MRLPISIYPYKNIEDYNLDYLQKKVDELKTILENFISLNTIKYANPIQWNITKQYEANTVVIDANDGTAYLSVKPVPTGVAITNTDYWTPIFTLNLLTANQNITLRDDGANTLATFTSSVDDWLIWNGVLYKVIRDIALNEAYVPGYNLTRYTVELFIDDLKISLVNMIGDLQNLDTTDKTNLVAAINEVLTRLNNISGDLQNLNTTDKSNLVAAINEVKYEITNINDSKLYTLNVLQFGVKNDGLTDCSAIVQTLLNTYAPCALYFPCGKYLFESKIEMPEKCQLLGDNNNESAVPMTGIDGAGGTVFLIDFTDDNFIVFRSGNVFKGILFYYPSISDTDTPSAIPFTFTWKTGLVNPIYGVKFQTLYFMNSWGCIECNQGHGDFIFNDIVASPARYGIHLDWSGGTDIFTDIRMSYFYFTSSSSAYAQYMQAHCEGIWFGYSDAFHAKALYFGNLNAGITFNISQLVTDGVAYGSIYGLSIDGCNYGIYSNGTHAIGVLISDMMANCITNGIMCAGNKVSHFRLSNCDFWSNANIRIQKACDMILTGCTFNVTANSDAINITDSGAKIIMTGCRFGDNVVPFRNEPASGTNTIIAKNNLSSVYPISNYQTVGAIYNDNNWASGSIDIGNATDVSLAGQNTILFNQGNAITISEGSGYAYPSGSELVIFNYGSSAGSVTANGVTKTIAAKTCVKLRKYAAVWYTI